MKAFIYPLFAAAAGYAVVIIKQMIEQKIREYQERQERKRRGRNRDPETEHPDD